MPVRGHRARARDTREAGSHQCAGITLPFGPLLPIDRRGGTTFASLVKHLSWADFKGTRHQGAIELVMGLEARLSVDPT